MARWIDTRSTAGDLLYSVRPCYRYSVWPADGGWYGHHHPDGDLFGKPVWRSPKAPNASTAQTWCRDHIVQQQQAAVAAGEVT